MIIKTDNFNLLFCKDLSEICGIKYKHKINGSYSRSDNGKYITDIDCTVLVDFYDRHLFSDFFERILRNKNFVFVKFGCGTRKNLLFDSPFEKKEFSYNRMIEWLNSEIVCNSISIISVEKIKQIIGSGEYRYISGKKIVEIKDIIRENGGELVWTVDEIKSGIKIADNISYKLSNVIREEQPVIELVYRYDNSICSVDLALVDTRVRHNIDRIGKFIKGDWYQIAKSVRNKIDVDRSDKETLELYNRTMESIKDYSSSIYFKQTLEKCDKYSVISKSELYDMKMSKDLFPELSVEKIKQRIDRKLKKHIFSFVEKLLFGKEKFDFVHKLCLSYESSVKIPVRDKIKNFDIKYTDIICVREQDIEKIMFVSEKFLLDTFVFVRNLKKFVVGKSFYSEYQTLFSKTLEDLYSRATNTKYNLSISQKKLLYKKDGDDSYTEITDIETFENLRLMILSE